jgi:hypothetical protein
VESEISVVVPHNLLHNRYMIETFVNAHLETILNLFVWSGVVLTVLAGVFIVKITASHNL